MPAPNLCEPTLEKLPTRWGRDDDRDHSRSPRDLSSLLIGFNLKWLILASAIILEVAASLAMQAAVSIPAWYTLVFTGYVGSFFLLVKVLKMGMSIGVAYSIWGASGVALTAIVASLLFQQRLTAVMILGLGLIIGGVILVELGSHHAHAARKPEFAARAGGGLD